jgi:hypothetical protein
LMTIVAYGMSEMSAGEYIGMYIYIYVCIYRLVMK